MSYQAYSPGAVNRYSAKKMAKPVNFVCIAPEAQNVSLVGDFNGWNPQAAPMRKQVDGAWVIQVPLNHGHHRYLFLVDSQPTLDPRAQGIARNEKNERVSLLSVS
jgi:1,4-alpha-glucan branching enzyme